MPISFACGQCGKDYLVSDGLAGKKAVCKACDHRMTIPGEPATAAARPTAVTRPASCTEPVARAVPRRAEPAEDRYGLNEAPAPLPRTLPRTAFAEATVAEAPVGKKKKKGGFFASSRKKPPGGPSYGSGGVGLVWLIRIVVVVASVGAAIGGYGLLSKSSMEGYSQQLIDMANQGTSALRSVQDSAAAGVVAPRVRDVFTRINDLIDQLKGTKGRDTEVDDVQRRYGPRLEAAYKALGEELRRVFSIPGAQAALGIDNQIQRLAGGTFSMPQMGPPPMPAQIARPMPVQLPQPGSPPGPQPGFGPGPRPGFGPGPRPGMPGGPPMGPQQRGARAKF